jgi:hypothetical protein
VINLFSEFFIYGEPKMAPGTRHYGKAPVYSSEVSIVVKLPGVGGYRFRIMLATDFFNLLACI